MQIIQSILQHPIEFILGLLLLICGVWLLRKAGAALVILLAMGTSVAALRWGVDAAWAPNHAGWLCAVCVLGAACGWVLGRHPVVARNAEVFFVVLLTLIMGREYAQALHWPLLAFAMTSIVGAYVAPVVTVSLFASSMICLAVGADALWVANMIWIGCLFAARTQNGRWTRGMHWDRSLVRELQAVGASENGGERSVQAVFTCRNQAALQRVTRQLSQLGIECESLLGPTAAAQLPVKLLYQWKQPWGDLLRIQPQAVYAGNREVALPPYRMSTSASGMTLEQAAAWLRSHNGDALADSQANGKGVNVAILDTGVSPATPKIRRALKKSVSFAGGEENDPLDHRGHGTMVADCVLAVAPQVWLHSVKVLDKNGRGTLFSVLRGLRYVAEHHKTIDIANLSLGAPCGGSGCPFCRAMEALAKLGVPSCSAIGNSGPQPGTVECPGASSGTLGVAALDENLNVARFSSRGPSKNGVAKPDLSNFGVNLIMHNHLGQKVAASGTSFASPLTAGVMAGAWQVLGGGERSVQRIYQLLRQTCVPVADGSRNPHATGVGIVNLKRAAEACGTRLARAADWIASPIGVIGRTAALAGCFVVTGAGWRFGIDHVGFAEADAAPNDVWLVGRVRRRRDTNTLLFDDGTGVADLNWRGDAMTEPKLGSIVILQGELVPAGDGRSTLIHGVSRFALAPEFVTRGNAASKDLAN